jgi:hypothetical protein
VLAKIRENSRHVTKDDEVVLQADEGRKQSENMQAAYHRLHQILVSSVSVDVPGVTSADQKKRVAQLYRSPPTFAQGGKFFVIARELIAMQPKAGRPATAQAEDYPKGQEAITTKPTGRLLVCLCHQPGRQSKLSTFYVCSNTICHAHRSKTFQFTLQLK